MVPPKKRDKKGEKFYVVYSSGKSGKSNILDSSHKRKEKDILSIPPKTKNESDTLPSLPKR